MRLSLTASTLVALSISACSASPPSSETRDDSSQAILSGSSFGDRDNLYGVAIYTGGPRPCSGVLLNAAGWVLTTRTCVVGSFGAPLTLRSIRLSRERSPGPTTPAGAAVAKSVVLHPTASLNLALVEAPALGAPTVTITPPPPGVSPPAPPASITDRWHWDGYGVPIHLGAPSTLAAHPLNVLANGYGLADFAALAGGDDSSAGVLRWASLVVSAANDAKGTFSLANGAAGAQAFVGDEGGGSFAIPTGCTGCVSQPWTLFGVHTTTQATSVGPLATIDTAVGAAVPWISELLGLTIESARRAATDGQRLFIQSNARVPPSGGAGATIRPFKEGSASNWIYSPSSGQLGNGAGLCLEVKDNGSVDDTPVRMNTCTSLMGAAQRWTSNRVGQIVAANGKCLSASTGAVDGAPLVIRTCRTSGAEAPNQQWIVRVGQAESTDYETAAGPYTTAHGAALGAEWSVIRYTTHGMPMFALMCKPLGASGPFPTQIINHGGAAGTEPGTEFPICIAGATKGWLTVVPSYRGEPVKVPNPTDATEKQYWSAGRPEICLGEVDDVLHLSQILHRHTELVDATRTAMLGESHGGCVTTRAVQRGVDVKRAMDISGPSDWANLYGECTGPNAAPLCGSFQFHDQFLSLASFFDHWIGAPPGLPTGATRTGYEWRSPATYGADLAARTTVRFMKLHGVADGLVAVSHAHDPRIFGLGTWKWTHLADGIPEEPTDTAVLGWSPLSGWPTTSIDYSAARTVVLWDGFNHLFPVDRWFEALAKYERFVTAP